MRQMYRYENMIRNTPVHGYRYDFNPKNYTHVWKARRRDADHVSITPSKNGDGFHISAWDGRVRYYYDSDGQLRRRSERFPSSIAGVDDRANTAAAMRTYLARHRR